MDHRGAKLKRIGTKRNFYIVQSNTMFLSLLQSQFINYRHTIEYQLLDNLKQLTNSDRLLVEKAYGAMRSAYAPYSKFSVGASVLLENG